MLWTLALAAAVAGGCSSKDEPVTPAAPGGSAATRPTGGGSATQPTADAVKSVTAAATTEAQKLIDQGTTYLKDNKLDLADGIVTKLQGMKADMPVEYQGKIDQLKQLVDAAKAAAATGMPKMPGM
jgi:hypothetical protein